MLQAVMQKSPERSGLFLLKMQVATRALRSFVLRWLEQFSDIRHTR